MYEEKNKNSHQTNQVLLSVLAVAILVVAVVGVSFAFFQYSRQGTTTNTINTGTLVFKYDETSPGIKLENAIPMSDTEVTTQNKLDSLAEGNVGHFDFTVSSTITGDMTINYEIAVEETSLPDELKTLDAKYVKVRLQKGTSATEYTGSLVEPTYFNALTNSNSGKTGAGDNDQLKTLYSDGSFSTGGGTHYYRFQMWLSDHYYNGAQADGDTNKTMMKNDQCTANTATDDGCVCAAEKGASSLTGDDCKLTERGTNGKTFSVKLNVYAKDATE